MWLLLYSLINAANFLKIHKVNHGDFSPKSVYISPGTNSFKILDVGMLKRISDTKVNENKQNFRAPELFQLKYNNSINPFFSDAFSIGLVLLYCINKGNISDIFYSISQENFKISEVLLEEKIKKISKVYYSTLLISIIKGLLYQKPEKRIKFEELFSFFEPFAKDIKNLKGLSTNELYQYNWESLNVKKNNVKNFKKSFVITEVSEQREGSVNLCISLEERVKKALEESKIVLELAHAHSTN